MHLALTWRNSRGVLPPYPFPFLTTITIGMKLVPTVLCDSSIPICTQSSQLEHKWMPQLSNCLTYQPNTNTILRLICTIPVTSCECERSVSVLRRLISALHNMFARKQEWNSLVIWTYLVKLSIRTYI